MGPGTISCRIMDFRLAPIGGSGRRAAPIWGPAPNRAQQLFLRFQPSPTIPLPAQALEFLSIKNRLLISIIGFFCAEQIRKSWQLRSQNDPTRTSLPTGFPRGGSGTNNINFIVDTITRLGEYCYGCTFNTTRKINTVAVFLGSYHPNWYRRCPLVGINNGKTPLLLLIIIISSSTTISSNTWLALARPEPSFYY